MMCGICGFIGNIEKREQVLKRMMNRIYHRGPDDSGSFFEGETAFGFRRLSIIDPANGRQPMCSDDSSIAVVFNGEIYNHLQLRSELTKKGHQFRTASDTESLLHGYEEYGAELLCRLRGMFAFAVWDNKAQSLFLARDPFGIKPLYYTKYNGCFAFASEIKSLLELPGIQPRLNLCALDQYLSFQYSVLPETFFQGIFRLPPGHYLMYQDGKTELLRYWTPELAPQYRQNTAKEKQHLRQCLADSITAHQLSDVEVGALLSGGVDSGFLLAQSKAKKSYTVSFDEDHGRYSEAERASFLADRLGRVNCQKTISAEEYWAALPKIAYHMDEPLADPSAAALYFVNQLAAQQVKVLLSGEGADELFGGYNIYHEPSSLRPFRILPQKEKQRLYCRLLKSPKHFRGKSYLLRGCLPLEHRFIGNAHLMDAREKRQLLQDDIPATEPYNLTQSTYHKNASQDEVTRMQEIDLRFWLPGDILLKADKMSMAHSVELRVPYLDKKVFGAARLLSRRNKVRGKTTKYLFRKIASEALPRQTSGRKKLGFPVPVRVWLRQPKYYGIVKDAFLSRTAKTYFQTDQLLYLLDAHYRGETDNSRKIWAVYQFLVWHKVYFENFASFYREYDSGSPS